MASIFAETLRALTPLFVLMLLGTWLRRSGMLRPEHVPVLNGLVVNVTLPALVVHSLATAPAVPRETLWLPLAMAVVEYVTMALAFAWARLMRLSSAKTGALMLVGAFGNTGFLGYPIVLAMFPRQFTATILVDQIGMGIVLFTSAPILGALLVPASVRKEIHARARAAVSEPASIASAPVASALPQKHWHDQTADDDPRHKALRNIAAFFRSPLFIAMLLGIAIRLIPWPAGLRGGSLIAATAPVVTKCLTYLGQGTVPLIMLSMGASLRPQAARAGVGPMLSASLLKLGVAPFVMWQLLRLVGVHGSLLTVGVMLAAMPAAVMAAVLGRHNGFDGDYSVGVVFVTTVLAALSLPLWLIFAR